MFYFEESVLGKWRPRTMPNRPSDRGPEGQKRNLRAVAEVLPSIRHLTLDQLQELYGPEGRFQAVVR